MFPPGYQLSQGSGLDRALLVKFMQCTYAEIESTGTYGHLAATVDQYFSQETPLWWVRLSSNGDDVQAFLNHPIACLWLGTAIDQVSGDRHAHIFLLYVSPIYRRQGIGLALMYQAEQWALARGDRKIGLQVFQSNQPAVTLYKRLGYEVQSLGMAKSLSGSKDLEERERPLH
ncbi:GNAT family N-acetyltransferase [Phormidium sp. CLA17]|uniref:GNAT family N-acetyltransferase n=1 Tax=Leptolyngbya sp. Cla-17 TaxID=2803751 RepID=UPI001492C1BB|nr:GNAT family N-acetyltransferase [Leptolyngbya sp. Cla-17]MBM0743917.1 GNAT family N-acetyltransferase [Leptolyngbya sp. Cla-17]